MQTSTKQYVSLTDFISIRFRCKGKGCNTELSLPLQDDYTKTHPADFCPNCGSGWLRLCNTTDDSAAPKLEQIVSSIRSISEWPGQCSVSLEIRQDGPQYG